jgi:hypothetical protein
LNRGDNDEYPEGLTKLDVLKFKKQRARLNEERKRAAAKVGGTVRRVGSFKNEQGTSMIIRCRGHWSEAPGEVTTPKSEAPNSMSGTHCTTGKTPSQVPGSTRPTVTRRAVATAKPRKAGKTRRASTRR